MMVAVESMYPYVRRTITSMAKRSCLTMVYPIESGKTLRKSAKARAGLGKR